MKAMRRAWPLPAAAVAALVCGGLVPDSAADISGTVFTIEASNGSGSGSFSALFEDGEWNASTQTFTWSLGAPVDVFDDGSGALVAKLLGASVTVELATVQVDMDVEVLAGSTDTEFYVDSALASFPTVPASLAEGKFFATATVTDTGGGGAFLMGLGAGGTGAFRAYYNGAAPDGTLFSHLISVVQVGNGGTGMASQHDPPTGYRPIGEDVYDMSVEMAFLLTADDEATGKGVFTVVPEPGGLALLALGGGLLYGRRRRG